MDAQDPSVAPLGFSVHLLAAAAKIAHQGRCGDLDSDVGPCDELLRISPEDWRAIVAQTTSTSPTADGSNRKVRFSMDLVGAAKLFFKPAGGDKFDAVGTVSGGKSLRFDDHFRPPDPPKAECASAKTKKPPTTPRTKSTSRTTSRTKPTPSYEPDDSRDDSVTSSSGGVLGSIDWAWLFGTSDDKDDMSTFFNQTLYMIAAAGLAMILVFSLCICIVYRSFRVRPSRSSSSSDDSSTRSKTSAHS